jgi:hypothetical protein
MAGSEIPINNESTMEFNNSKSSKQLMDVQSCMFDLFAGLKGLSEELKLFGVWLLFCMP